MNRTSAVNRDIPFANAFCSEYEALLDHCQVALSAWSESSERARHAEITGEAVGRELLRLQARFAKSYELLQKHVRNCERCIAASHISEIHLDREANSAPVC